MSTQAERDRLAYQKRVMLGQQMQRTRGASGGMTYTKVDAGASMPGSNWTPSFEPLPTVNPVNVGGLSSYYSAPKTRGQMEGLLKSAADIAPQQVNAGRALEASQLNAASERLARTGSSIGANKFARQAAWNKLATQMAAERGTREADISVRGQELQRAALGDITGADQTAQSQALQYRSQEAAREAQAIEAQMQRAQLDISQQGLLGQSKAQQLDAWLKMMQLMQAEQAAEPQKGFSFQMSAGGGSNRGGSGGGDEKASSGGRVYRLGQGWLTREQDAAKKAEAAAAMRNYKPW